MSRAKKFQRKELKLNAITQQTPVQRLPGPAAARFSEVSIPRRTTNAESSPLRFPECADGSRKEDLMDRLVGWLKPVQRSLARAGLRSTGRKR